MCIYTVDLFICDFALAEVFFADLIYRNLYVFSAQPK